MICSSSGLCLYVSQISHYLCRFENFGMSRDESMVKSLWEFLCTLYNTLTIGYRLFSVPRAIITSAWAMSTGIYGVDHIESRITINSPLHFHLGL